MDEGAVNMWEWLSWLGGQIGEWLPWLLSWL